MDFQPFANWKTTRTNTTLRKRRTPEAEELKYAWEDRFQSEYGVFRSEVNKAFNDFLNCGILYHGCALARFETCSHSELIAFSCKKRGICPSCDAKRAVIFAEHLYQNVLPKHPASHIVFTIPKRLRVFFKYNRKLTKHLYTAAWNTWKELIEDAFPDCESGMIIQPLVICARLL